jgi:hypothetical protein
LRRGDSTAGKYRLRPIADAVDFLYIAHDHTPCRETAIANPIHSSIEVTMDQQLPASQLNAEPMSTKDWFITLLITYIPLVGLIMLLVWAFDSSTNLNKKNFAKASLLWVLIGIGLAIIFFVLFASLMMGVVGSMEN